MGPESARHSIDKRRETKFTRSTSVFVESFHKNSASHWTH